MWGKFCTKEYWNATRRIGGWEDPEKLAKADKKRIMKNECKKINLWYINREEFIKLQQAEQHINKSKRENKPITEEQIIREVIENNNKHDEREGNTKRGRERKRRPYEKECNTNGRTHEEFEFIDENVELEQKQDMSIH